MTFTGSTINDLESSVIRAEEHAAEMSDQDIRETDNRIDQEGYS
jgi:hypothetical protein